MHENLEKKVMDQKIDGRKEICWLRQKKTTKIRESKKEISRWEMIHIKFSLRNKIILIKSIYTSISILNSTFELYLIKFNF